ncbi:MAG: permease [Chloroflexi bacterium]|nr:permease [Chloroflexota bacterium]
MDTALLILLVLLALAIIAAFWKGRWTLVWAGLKQTGRTLKAMWFRILLGMALGGFIQVLVPSASIAEWLGPASGLKGILIGSYVGLFLSGGPYVILPVVAAIYKAGAGAGPVIALLAGGLLSVQGLITWYIPFLGVRLSLAKYVVCLFVPPLVGLAGGAVFGLLNLS